MDHTDTNLGIHCLCHHCSHLLHSHIECLHRQYDVLYSHTERYRHWYEVTIADRDKLATSHHQLGIHARNLKGEIARLRAKLNSSTVPEGQVLGTIKEEQDGIGHQGKRRKWFGKDIHIQGLSSQLKEMS